MQLKFDFVATSSEPAAPSAKAPDKGLETERRRMALELRMHLGTNVAVVLHTNRQSMLTAERTRLGYLLRMHRIFAAASSEVIQAVARFVDRNDRHAALVIDSYIDAYTEEIVKHAKPSSVKTSGRFFQLQTLFDALNSRFFDNSVESRITWGKAASMRRRSIKLGSYHANERLIRIHPALDQSFVPGYFVEFVIFHEMLHERLGTRARTTNGRRCVHPPEFRDLEARFPHADAAAKWERENINRLLRFRPD